SLQQLHRRFRSLSHGVLEAPMGVSFVSQQSGALQPQLQNVRDNSVVVVLVTVVAAINEHLPYAFPQRSLSRTGKERIKRRTCVGDDALAAQPLLSCRCCRGCLDGEG